MKTTLKLFWGDTTSHKHLRSTPYVVAVLLQPTASRVGVGNRSSTFVAGRWFCELGLRYALAPLKHGDRLAERARR